MSGPPPRPDDHRPGPLLRWGAPALLALALWAPLATMALAHFGWKLPGQLNEKRELAAWPKFEASVKGAVEWPRSYEAWFNDHFGLRTQLISANSRFQVLVLKTSPATTADLDERRKSTVLGKGFAWPRVIVGRKGWLFVTVNAAIDQNRGKQPLTDFELRLWRQTLEQRQAYCQLRGAKYIYAICPDKETIYPDLLPREVKFLPNDPRAVQVSNYMAATCRVPFVSLVPTLRKARQENELPIFYKYNSHWTQLGGFTGAQRIVEEVTRLFPAVPPLRREDYNIVRDGDHVGDLSTMLGLEDVLIDEKWNLVPKRPARAKLIPSPLGDLTIANKKTVAWSTGDKTLPRVLIFHDSFTPYMDEYLCEGFQEAVLVWDLQFYPEIVDQYKPDLVMTISVGRLTNLYANPPAVVKALQAAAAK